MLDTVGEETFRRSIECVVPRGQVVTILASTPGDRAPMLLYRSITVHYEFMGVPVAHGLAPERQGAALASLARLVDAGLLRPHVSARFALDRVADAHRAIETGRTVGKIVVDVEEAPRD